MICPKCQTEYPTGQRFCNTCAENNRPVLLQNKTVDPSALAAYKRHVEQFLDDGFLEDSEKQVLAALRKQYGISDQQHHQILSQYQFRDTFPVRVVYNLETLKGYAAAQSCLLLLRVVNLEDLPLKALTFRYRLNGGAEQTKVVYQVPQQQLVDVSLPFFPERAGQYTFSMEIDVQPFIGDGSTYTTDAFNFQVYAHQQAQQVHIHQSAENIVGNLKFDTDATTAKLLGRGQWAECTLRPKANVSEIVTTQTSSILAGLEAIPGLSRFELEFILGGQPTRKLSVASKERVAFGKNKAKSDLRIALEPFVMEAGANPALVANNKRMTIGMISSLHFAISRQGNRVLIEDCGSTNGTLLNGKTLIPHKKTELEDGSTVMVGKTLELQVTIFANQAGVLLTQPKHYPRREHLILWGTVGFSNFQRGIVEEFDGQQHTCSLEMVNNKACIVNYGRKKMTMVGMQAGFRDGCPVQQGMDFEIGRATVIVNAI